MASLGNKPQYMYYEKFYIPNTYVNIFIGKKFKNINNIKSLSPEVNVIFISDREQSKSKIIIKSNNNAEFSRVIKFVKDLMTNSYNIYKDIQKERKEKRKVEHKLREIKIKTEISKRIEDEIKDKEMEKLKLSCINTDKYKEENEKYEREKNFSKYKSKNPFYGLDVDYDE